METAKLFRNGRSQAVRLPKEYNFSGTEVFIRRAGESVILFPKNKEWETFLEGLNGFTDDFMEEGRCQPDLQDRKDL
ncbi:antitoxin [Treponema sp. OMZ 792]|uniref:type II toxin-antitoxin system antitoxin VapB n=1 Tax=unclassified Treponema TaxID=2638727 RepID=UPI0020A584C2|nr:MULTISPECIES: type II toxin-antitoxin system VapB family antitoxin [unclassified Treponema]UTC74827.1 antitoxin [Treponema sp. OMZ 792]UTC81221.1 antitoxin [Treponema sp. OMZ 798]